MSSPKTMIHTILTLLQEGQEAAGDLLKKHPAVGIASGAITAILSTVNSASLTPAEVIDLTDLAFKYIGITLSLAISTITFAIKIKEWRKKAKEEDKK